jgi:hypothetical protein
MWTIGVLAFFMSSILDNLTTTIVMISLLRKIVPNPNLRKLFGALVVIAANAGGAWTPIGDVTTTMLWINGQITAVATMKVGHRHHHHHHHHHRHDQQHRHHPSYRGPGVNFGSIPIQWLPHDTENALSLAS